MESPIERKCITSAAENYNYNEKMNSSINSTLDDTTPSDSGVQMDSEVSDVMVESLTSQNGILLDYENVKNAVVAVNSISMQPPAPSVQLVKPVEEETVVDSNSNITKATTASVEDAMSMSTCSTFDTNVIENIVYRRKVRKSGSNAPKAPKKRVSFHEDILKSKRTDNIHIEHGFVTYKNGRKVGSNVVAAAGRYSWCSEGDGAASAAPTELCTQDGDGDCGEGAVGGSNGRRRIVYRNACSDVLDYGNSDVYDTNESGGLQYDNSGVFEYLPQGKLDKNAAAGGGTGKADVIFYRCSCSSSNSSLDSDGNDKNCNHKQYGQAKSSSCDCIGLSNANNNNLIGDNCYYSEPNINEKKSVWNKEKKPKSSCLKKTQRNTNIILEQDLTNKVKKFNVHDMNQLLDNSSKMLIGSLKSIFTMPLPERGVPEGSEDLQAVVECTPDLEQTPEHKSKLIERYTPESPTLKAKPFLSKSLDGSKQQQSAKKFVHNVDEQLRRNKEEELYLPTRENSSEKGANEQQTPKTPLQRQEEIDGGEGEVHEADIDVSEASIATTTTSIQAQNFRSKFIINCESTVFEHTGVSYESQAVHNKGLFNEQRDQSQNQSAAGLLGKSSPIVQAEPENLRRNFITAPLAKTFSNFFKSLKESSHAASSATAYNKRMEKLDEMQKNRIELERQQQEATNKYFALKLQQQTAAATTANFAKCIPHKLPTTSSSSTISDLTMSTNSNASSLPQEQQQHQHNQPQQQQLKCNNDANNFNPINPSQSYVKPPELRTNLDKQTRHLPSPLRKRSSSNNLQTTQPPRYGTTPIDYNIMLNSDILNTSQSNGYMLTRGGSGRDSKSTILSEEFDDILTITTTDTDKPESDIVILDYPDVNDRQAATDYANLLKPPQPPAAKTSLINRFLRNVTQKKILETSIRKNNFFASKLRNEKGLFGVNLYVPGAKPKNYDLIDDLNAEIAMEIEMSASNSPRRELAHIDADLPGDISRFELGIGEISIDIFSGISLPMLQEASEQLMKVFKLYTGYSPEGYMLPVLVFLSDKALYVTDLVRNRLCTKFVLAYTDLDVILMGPYGNTVLLSNSSRDMQQVLLSGGPYPADGLVANLELCARRSGSPLPAVGQLTFEHLAPLQEFVCANCRIDKEDTWMYYAVVNVPAFALGKSIDDNDSDQEPMGPHVKGFLMHRRVKENASMAQYNKQSWCPGYFLLKAGVLYMFNDSNQKLPSWAVALAECQGARRSAKTGRPHCFELLLKTQILQLAAPDEYVASEWLQALLQSASGLFEMQGKHKTLGCTLVVTQNHLITLREDFSAPLRQVSKDNTPQSETANLQLKQEEELRLPQDNGSLFSSAMSTPTRGCGTQQSCSSINSTPTKLSQLSRSSANTTQSITMPSSYNAVQASKQFQQQNNETCFKGNYTNMNSVYGKNSGLEILTYANIKEMTGIKIPSHNDTWWCILEFSCQEAPLDCSDDLVLFFATSTEMQRFLRLLEQLWQAKNNDLFPITILDEDDFIAEQCTLLYLDINRSWEPLLTAALGYPS